MLTDDLYLIGSPRCTIPERQSVVCLIDRLLTDEQQLIGSLSDRQAMLTDGLYLIGSLSDRQSV